MSRHVFLFDEKTGYHSVLMGWDRPLQQHFMVICKDPDEDEPFYSNLYEETPCSLLYFLEKLADLGLSIPESMVGELVHDEKHNVGNKDIVHTVKNGVYHRSLGFDEVILIF